jgi:hypothetical protein
MSALREFIAAAEAAGWDTDPNNAPILNAARAALPEMIAVLEDCIGNINPERGYADELEQSIRAAIVRATVRVSARKA